MPASRGGGLPARRCSPRSSRSRRSRSAAPRMGDPPERRCEGYSSGRVAHHPGGSVAVPELEPAVVGGDLVAPEKHRAAARKLRHRPRPRLPGPDRHGAELVGAASSRSSRGPDHGLAPFTIVPRSPGRVLMIRRPRDGRSESLPAPPNARLLLMKSRGPSPTRPAPPWTRCSASRSCSSRSSAWWMRIAPAATADSLTVREPAGRV